MKSIVQEASTIAKAVELGWRQAGEPQEFSVKILELPQHNFLGMTTRSAKVAVLFNGVVTKKTRPEKPQKHQQKRSHEHQKPEPQKSEHHQNNRQQAPKKPVHVQEKRQEPVQKQSQPAIQEPAAQPKQNNRKKPEGLWNSELVACAETWLTKTIKHMDRHDITFTVEPQNFYLRITFNKPILKDEAQEKHLLASLSSLMLATVKKHFRKALRGHKIVLTHAQ